MPNPFSVQCPNCDAKLKIQNPAAVGKKVRCPNCQNPFTVKAPRSAAPKDDFDTDDDYDDDFGGGRNDDDDDFGGRDDDFDDDFGPPRSSSRKSSGSRSSSSKKSAKAPKSKKKSKKKSNNKTPLLIGGGVVAFLLLVGLGFLIFNLAGGGGGGGINTEDLAWLSPNTQVVVTVNVDEAWNSPVVQRFANMPELKGGVDEMKQEFEKLGFEPGESLDTIDSMTLGFEKAGDDPTGVFRKKTAWNVEVMKQKQNLEEQTHDGKTYYKMGLRDAMYFPDDKTMIIGREDQIKDAMTRQPSSQLAERFAFLPKGHIVMGGYPPAEELAQMKQQLDSNPMIQMGMMGQEDFIKDIIAGAKELQGGGMGITLGSGVELEIVGKCSNSGAAGKLSGGIGDMLSRAKRDFKKERANVAKMGGPNMAGQMNDGLDLVESLLNSMDADRSGDTASLSMEVTSSMIDKGEALFKQLAGQGGFPGLPQIPGFNFGNLMGGGGGMGGGPDFGGGGPIGNAREAAQRAESMNNLKQIGLAMHNYHEVYNAFPPGRNAQQGTQLSWRVHLLPYLGQAPLYESFHLNEPWDSQHNLSLVPHMPPVFRRPGSNADPGKTNYVGISGPGGVMENGGGQRFADIVDGTSNTIMVTEVRDYAAVTWTQPVDYNYNASSPIADLGGFTGGFHILLCDGSVKFVSSTIDPQNLVRLFQRNDGQIVEDF